MIWYNLTSWWSDHIQSYRILKLCRSFGWWWWWRRWRRWRLEWQWWWWCQHNQHTLIIMPTNVEDHLIKIRRELLWKQKVELAFKRKKCLNQCNATIKTKNNIRYIMNNHRAYCCWTCISHVKWYINGGFLKWGIPKSPSRRLSLLCAMSEGLSWSQSDRQRICQRPGARYK